MVLLLGSVDTLRVIILINGDVKAVGKHPLLTWALLLAFRDILLIRKGVKLCWA